jgi:hypothetical protein
MPVSGISQSVEQERSGECVAWSKSQSIALPSRIDDFDNLHSSAMLPMATGCCDSVCDNTHGFPSVFFAHNTTK